MHSLPRKSLKISRKRCMIFQKDRRFIFMLQFVRNQHFIQNNELLVSICFGVEQGNGKLGIDLH